MRIVLTDKEIANLITEWARRTYKTRNIGTVFSLEGSSLTALVEITGSELEQASQIIQGSIPNNPALFSPENMLHKNWQEKSAEDIFPMGEEDHIPLV